MKIFKILFIIILAINISGCRWFSGSGLSFVAFTDIRIPPGTPKFKKGFKDGCGSVLHSRGNIFYRSIYTHSFDPKLIDDSEYSFGYKRGYSYCFQRQFGIFGGGADQYLANPPSFTQGMGPGSIDLTVNPDGAARSPLGGAIVPDSGLDGVVGYTTTNKLGNTGVFGAYPTWGSQTTGQNFGW